jgi:SanA protein
MISLQQRQYDWLAERPIAVLLPGPKGKWTFRSGPGQCADTPAEEPSKRRPFAIALALLGVAVCLWLLAPTLLGLSFRSITFSSVASIPARPIAIVFGAGVTSRGKLTPILRARVDAAVALYRAGKVRMLLMSGDDAHVYHNEPGAMRLYAIRQGVASADIICDDAGFRTYDTCYRARRIFGVTQAVLVTQSFHLARALLTARCLGIDAIGYAAASPNSRLSQLRMAVREDASLVLCVRDLLTSRRPKFLGRPQLVTTQYFHGSTPQLKSA